MLYIGVTSHLQKRVYEHREGIGSVFTQKYNLRLLVYYESFDDMAQAILREKSLKGKTRKKKDDLISSLNPSWKDLLFEIW